MNRTNGQRLERLLETGRQLAENRTLEPLLDYAMDTALALFGAEYGHIILLRQDGTLDFRVHRTRAGDLIPSPEKQISQTLLKRVIEEREDLVLADAADTTPLPKDGSIITLRMRSLICVPLVSRDRVIGAIYLENRTKTSVFTEADVPPLKIFAGQVAVAIENAALNDELETRVATRTAELEEANEELTKLVEELRTFAHAVAHDLRSPLSTIATYAQLLATANNRMSPEEQSKYAQRIARFAFKMEGFIDSLLMIARIRSAVGLELRALDMDLIVEDALGLIAATIESYQAEVALPDSWPVAVGYTPWVEEIWVNYLSNAVKFGGKPPRITLGSELLPEGMVRFWIRDNGVGLSEEELGEMFIPFKRFRPEVTDGYGLGLSIVRRIVERLGGDVDVRSQPGQGCEFGFTLPAASEQHVAQPQGGINE